MSYILSQLHTGGITEVVSIERETLPIVIERLANCQEHHGTHVFVVDGSSPKRYRIGVSTTGLECMFNGGLP